MELRMHGPMKPVRYRQIAGFVLVVWLQTVSGVWAGSLYSVYGLGQNAILGSAHYRALGGGGLALPEGLSVNPLNPAASVPFPLTRVSGTFLHEGSGLRTTSATGWHNYSSPVAFDFHVPISSRWGFVVGFRPLTLRSYRLRSHGSFLSHSFQGDSEVGFQQIREGKGGLQALSADLCHLFGKRISLGIGGRFLFGRLEDTWRVNFERTDFRASEDQYSVHLRGAAFVAGVMANVTKRWYFGAFYQTNAPLHAERRGESRYTYSDTVRSFSTNYPAILGVGQALELGERWVVVADYLRQDWRDWRMDREPASDAGSWYQISAGVQFTPKTSEYSPFWKKTVARFGAYQRGWPFSPVPGESLVERALTFGLGFPLPESRGRLDIAFEYGKRGDKANLPVEERFLRFVITFVGAEKWFVRAQ
jgi:hypothetical protein